MWHDIFGESLRSQLRMIMSSHQVQQNGIMIEQKNSLGDAMFLVAPYRAVLRYYRCDTPYRATPFQRAWHSPKMVRYPSLILSTSFTQAHLCDTLCCNKSRHDSAILHNKISTKQFHNTIATSIARNEKVLLCVTSSGLFLAKHSCKETL